jgi:hypothetical protein
VNERVRGLAKSIQGIGETCDKQLDDVSKVAPILLANGRDWLNASTVLQSLLKVLGRRTTVPLGNWMTFPRLFPFYWLMVEIVKGEWGDGGIVEQVHQLC